jgi:hypothetical protein
MKKSSPAPRTERTLQTSFLGGDEPGNRAHYDEYVRGFDDIPTLDDAVIIPPRPRVPPSFVRGERRNLRKQERPDGYTQREASLAELEALYREYLDPQAARRKRKTAARKKPSRRKSRRAKRAAH